jgi:hypothetical protein
MATPNLSFMRRYEDYKPTKTMLFWFGAVCAIATMIVGFSWGGWVTGGTAAAQATTAADGARANLAAAYCVTEFKRDPAEATQLVSLNKIDHWDRASFITKGGWTTLPGTKDPVSGAAELCSQQLADLSAPTAAATGASK